MYRFFDFRSDGAFANHARERQIFETNEMFFSARWRFNDPFETAPYTHWEPASEFDIATHIARMAAVNFELPSDQQEFRHRMMEILAANPTLSQEIHEKVISDVEANASAVCMTKRYTHPLMWSHYAAKHTGYCVGYDFTGPSVEEALPEPIIYSPERPRIALNKDMGTPSASREFAALLFLRKASYWQYEQEYRLIQMRPEGLFSVPNARPSILMLGARIEPLNREKLLTFATQGTYGIRCILQASLSPDRYELEFRPLEKK